MNNEKIMRLALMMPLLAPAVGCGDDAVDPAETPAAISATFHINEFVPGGGGAAIEASEVCLLDIDAGGCADTDAEGAAMFENVAPGEKFAARFTTAGFVTTLLHSYLPEEDADYAVAIASDAIAQAFADSVMITWPDAQNGVVAFNTFDAEGNAKTGVELSISSGSGEGPFYTTAAGLPDVALTATEGQLGFFTSLPPGEYEVTAPGCEVTTGWEGSASDAATVVVEANTLSNVGFVCP